MKLMSRDAAAIRLDPTMLAMDIDRGRAWEKVRSAGPVVELGDTIMLTRRDDVLDALRHPEVFSSQRAFDRLGSPPPLYPISFDAPEHTGYRRILQPFFSPRALGGLMPSLRDQAAAMIDELAERGGCDAIAELAVPYPSQVFLTLFGFPRADRDRLIAWKDSVLTLFTQADRHQADLAPALELFDYVRAAVAERRRHPGEDLLSQLLTAPHPLGDHEAVGLSFLFVIAGLDTVTSSLGFALWKLATRPDLRRALRADPERMPAFIEELLRLEPPVPSVPRVTTREVIIGDVTLPEGTLVHLCIAASGREQTEPPMPEDVELDGRHRRHWAFGAGAHRCLGSHLARLELHAVLTRWLQRIPEFELAPGADPRVAYPSATFSFHSLPLLYPQPAGQRTYPDSTANAGVGLTGIGPARA
jgi:hypothetical protein